MRDILEVAVDGHIGRRVRPVPRVVGAVVRVQHIVARILEVFCRLFALFHVAADLDIILAGHRALAEALCLADHGIAQGNGIIVPAGGFDCGDHLDGETVAVFETAAVFVGAVVGVPERELVEEIALVHGMDFDAVDACLLALQRRHSVGMDDFFDLLARQGAAGDILLIWKGAHSAQR